jgi:lysophospholipase L1-like esterase
VALGDSFTEGMGDTDPHRPNGVRGWADRVAEQMSVATPGVQYANLAIRGKRLEQIVSEQLGPALALRPDLVALFAGVNDLMHVRVRMDELMTVYEDVVAKVRATGARVLLFTISDPEPVWVFRPFRGRIAIYNELVRKIARKHDATVVDLWDVLDVGDRRLWGDDRLHLATPGHEVVAGAVCDAIGIPHNLRVEKASVVARTRRQRAAWLMRHALPWFVRRLRGRSLGDGLTPRYPALTPPVLDRVPVVAREVPTSLTTCDSSVTSPSGTPSPKASATPTPDAPTPFVDGPTELPPPSRSAIPG